MKIKLFEPLQILPRFFIWFLIASLVGLLAGSASAIFLYGLDWVTVWRESHLWILIFLAPAGFVMGWVYHRLGKSVEGGSNLLLDEIHEPKTAIPRRMAPLILFATWVTHLFGGSAGREGVAVQMGGCLADQLGKPFGLSSDDRRVLLMAGMSAGFGSVFGTPLAGAVFGLEVLAIGRLRYEAIFPCFIASIIGNAVTLAWGIHHEQLTLGSVPLVTLPGVFYALIAGVIFGISGMLFAKAIHGIEHVLAKKIAYSPWRPFLGGATVALLVLLIGTTRYIGLGVPVVNESFVKPLPVWDFAGKFIFTVLTLGSGFKGGEVTPLFFIGATLGNALSHVLALPLPVLAAMGFVAVFAGASNTPLACTILAMEVFGSEIGVYAGIACVVSYLFSGHAGIYHSQQIGHLKTPPKSS